MSPSFIERKKSAGVGCRNAQRRTYSRNAASNAAESTTSLRRKCSMTPGFP